VPAFFRPLFTGAGRLPVQVSGPLTVLPAITVASWPVSNVTGPRTAEASIETGPEAAVVIGPVTVLPSSATEPAPTAVTAPFRVAPVA
jgi:hypothetical protein